MAKVGMMRGKRGVNSPFSADNVAYMDQVIQRRVNCKQISADRVIERAVIKLLVVTTTVVEREAWSSGCQTVLKSEKSSKTRWRHRIIKVSNTNPHGRRAAKTTAARLESDEHVVTK